MENEQAILYETLSPLGAGATDTPTPPPSTTPPPLSQDDEPYVILRSEISLSSVRCPSPATLAPDYFSLDLNDAEETKGTPPFTPRPPSPPQAQEAAITKPERTLEGNWFRANCRFKSPMLQLHREIIDFCDFLSPTPEEQTSRNAAIESVSDVIKYIWGNAKVEVFGSFKTGLYLPSSDVDVVILGSEIRSPQLGLQALSRALSQKGIAKKIQVIARARVPIVKFVEKKSGVSFDISFDIQSGPKSAEFITDAISKWPPLRPLCLILKVFLQQRELNEVYTGGIGSYALLVMLIAMLQSQQDRQASPEYNLGILLVNFFDVYGRKLNTTDVGVSCNGGGTFFLKSSKGFLVKGKPSVIAIEDPQDPDNDIGKSSYNYFQVRSAFAMAFTTLTNAKAIMGLGPSRSILGTIIRPDAVLLERKRGSSGELTLQTLLPGAGEPLKQQFSDKQEIYCNWQLDDDEEPLPRGHGISEDGYAQFSRKKRRASKENKPAKKVKENRDRREEIGTTKERSAKKQRWRHHQRNGDSNRQSGGGGGGSSSSHLVY
ncbi:non-canonical poly(A) RNA polymerase PAPD5-like isoform X2 [Olea europaea var. sylvestris]|uniref:non-canonical poly(A) RNA polymerase PAPD5-like isoform X2 n=1 Tax=Olea europaea var. sylvestris TaxID=158386 RepID=UPI000C1CE0C7|nr:non-canonical poly(A) RNA polymerase PAPD5-like isoform X2 [Olea europaea var. sylvestris]